MKVPKDNKEREARISKELKSIEEMYNLAFTIKDKAANKIKGFKQCFKFVADETILLSIAKKLAEQVKELEAFEPVKKVIVEDTLPGNWHRLLVRAEPGTDTREKAAAIIASHGFAARHIYRHIPSLEDVFVEMTRRD